MSALVMVNGTKFYGRLRSLCSIPLCLMCDTSADGQAVSNVPAGKCSKSTELPLCSRNLITGETHSIVQGTV